MSSNHITCVIVLVGLYYYKREGETSGWAKRDDDWVCVSVCVCVCRHIRDDWVCVSVCVCVCRHIRYAWQTLLHLSMRLKIGKKNCLLLLLLLLLLS